MRYTQENSKLLHKAEIAPGIYNFTLVRRQGIAKAAAAGQFVNVLCGAHTLRRPISICGFDASLGILRLVFEIRGKGTEWLAGREAGETVDLVGPLGHGFPLLETEKRAVMVGGGIGTPPLLPLVRHCGANATGLSPASAAGRRGDIAGRYGRQGAG